MPFDFLGPSSNDPNADPMFEGMDGLGDDQPVPGNAESYGEQEAPIPGAPAGYVAPGMIDQLLNPAEPQEEDYEQVLSQVDRRMRVAHFYRSILDSELFSEKTSEAKIVQNRIRKFCNDELEVIFGMRTSSTAPVGGQFTDDEVKFVKDLFARMAAKADEKTKKPLIAPTVNRVTAKPPPAVQTIQTQNKPSAPPPKPQPKPMQQAPVQQQPVAQPKQPAPGGDLRIPELYRKDPTARVMKGKVYVQARNDDGEPLFRTVDPKNGNPIKPVPIMKDVTPVAKPTGPIQPLPMPDQGVGEAGINSAFSQVMQSHANATLSSLERASGIRGVGGSIARNLGGALAISLAGGGGQQSQREDEEQFSDRP